jgi:hypothetical protein
MAQKLMESFYRYALFSLTAYWWHAPHLIWLTLPHLLQNDRFGHGLRPQTLIFNFTHMLHLSVDEGSASSCKILRIDLILGSLWKLSLLKFKE